MIDHGRLETALSELAQLLLDDFVVDDVLQRLCDHAVNVLAVFGAGVSLRTQEAGAGAGLRVAWSTSDTAGKLEALQAQIGEGPCIDAMSDRRVQHAQLPEIGARWPRYRAEVARLGVRSLAAAPLVARDHVWGALDVYSTRDEPFGDDELRTLSVLTDAASAYLLTAWDRQARQAGEDRLRQQTLRDPLTGLANRLLITDRLEHALARTDRHSGEVGVLFMDLDRFKQINDALGHAAGDRLLIAVARRLETVLRPSDTLSRWGGDEFVVLCEDLHNGLDGLQSIGWRLVDVLTEPLPLDETEVIVQASFGAVLATADDTASSVLHDADVAMYQTKRSGGGLVVSDRRPNSVMEGQVRTETELRRCLARRELRMSYQPIVSLRDGSVLGVEALLRWAHPQRGLLAAAEFVPLAERIGLMGPFGLWVLRQVFERFGDLRPAGATPDWFVAVNVSAQQLRSPNFAAEVQELLAETQTDPANVILEVTETELVAHGDRGTTTLRTLSDMGLRIAIDDFGTGYSSLAYLSDLPVDVVKIDKRFVDRLGSTARDDIIVRAAITMVHDLALFVVAEGIETSQQHEFLAAAGCDAGQGFLYGRPTIVNAPQIQLT